MRKPTLHDGLTDEARRIVRLAEREARRRDHSVIGTVHLLLGVALDSEGAGARILKDLGAGLEDVCRQVDAIVRPGRRHVKGKELPFSSRGRNAMIYAAQEAAAMGEHHVGAVHLLLALVRDPACIAAKALSRAGLRLPHIRQRGLEVREEQDRPGQTSSAAEPADPELGEVETAWPALPRSLRHAILAIVRTDGPAGGAGGA